MSDAMQEALTAARSHLITLGGDPRSVIAEFGSPSGDEIQAAVLDMIDAALSTCSLVPASAVADMRERCARVHDEAEASHRQSVIEVAALPGHEKSCPGLLETHDQMADMHKRYAERIRALDLSPAGGGSRMERHQYSH